MLRAPNASKLISMCSRRSAVEMPMLSKPYYALETVLLLDFLFAIPKIIFLTPLSYRKRSSNLNSYLISIRVRDFPVFQLPPTSCYCKYGVG